VRQQAQLLRRAPQQLGVARRGVHRAPKVDRAVHHRLLLVALQDARDDRLGRDALAAVVDHGRAEHVQAGRVEGEVRAHALYSAVCSQAQAQTRRTCRSLLGAAKAAASPPNWR